MLDGQAFNPFALFDDGCGPAKVGVGWCHVVEALVVAPMVVLLDEGVVLGLKVSGAGSSFPAGCGSLRVWCQRLILPWVCLGRHRSAPGQSAPDKASYRRQRGFLEADFPERGASFHA